MPEEEHLMKVDEGRLRQSSVPVSYPSNSKTAREKPPEKKRPEKAFDGEVVRRPPGVGKKLVKGFLSEDSGTVGSYVLLEVVLPAVKDLLVESGKQALERIFYGDVRPRRGRDERSGYLSYNRMSDRREPAQHSNARPAQGVRGFDEYELPDRVSAIAALDRLEAHLGEYHVASVADLCDILGITSEFTDNKWGWTSLSQASIRQVRGGKYILVLPPTKPLT